MTEPNVEQVRIFNSEVSTHYYLYVRPDRLFAFKEFVLTDRRPGTPPPTMPGLSWSAILGLDAIFHQRPKKFPTNDILLWLQEQVDDITVSLAEIEDALERFSRQFPPDVSATEDA